MMNMCSGERFKRKGYSPHVEGAKVRQYRCKELDEKSGHDYTDRGEESGGILTEYIVKECPDRMRIISRNP